MASEEDRVVENESAENDDLSAENDSNKKKRLSVVLDCFGKIVKNDKNVRAKGGVGLIKQCFHRVSNENGEKDFKYTLGRLIRGLGATKNASRCGYFATLSALFQSVEIEVDDVLSYIEKELHTSGNNSKSENADILTGHILVCGAIFRSNLFQKSTLEQQQKIIQMLLHAGKKKSYLSVMAYSFLTESFDTMTGKEFEDIILPILKPEITKSLDEFTLDNLYFLLKAHEKFPAVFKAKFLKKLIGFEDIICADSIKPITGILMHVLPIPQNLKHPVYQLAGKQIAKSDCIEIFLSEVDLILSRPTQMRHMVAAVILRVLVENLENKKLLVEILTRNFLQQTLAHFRTVNSKNQDDLQLLIYEFFDALVKALKVESKIKVKLAVMRRLLFFPGTFIFEKITRSKVLQQIIATLNADGVKKLAKMYCEVLLAEKDKQRNENTTETWLNLDRVFAAQLIVKLLNHPELKEEIDWKFEQLQILMKSGLIKNEKIGVELAASLKETFFNALALKLPKLEDLRMVLSKLVHQLNEEIGEDYTTTMRSPFKQEDYDMRKKTLEVVDALENKTKKKHLTPVFHTLFLQMSLQLFNDTKLATDSLNELFSCYERIKKKNKNDEEDFKWIEVIVDLFLNLLSQNSHMLRNLIGCVFPHLCKDLTADAVHQILAVLDPKGDVLEEDDDASDESDDDKESSDEESDENEDEEEETVNDKLKQAVWSALGGDEGEDMDVDELSEGECEKLNSALGAAFKQFKPNMGKKSKKQNKDDETLTHFRVRVLDLIDVYLDSDVSMILSLEIMLPLLQGLEFSIRDPHQKPLHDRIKACLKKLAHLKKFSSIEDVNEDTLSNLLSSILEKGTKNVLLIQEMGANISDCCVFIIRCVQYIINLEDTPKKLKKKLTNRTNTILNEAVETYFKKRDCLTPYVLFKNIIQMVWDGNMILAEKLVTYVFDTDIRPFRRNQALELLNLFYNNNRLLTSDKFNLNEIESIIYSKTIELFETEEIKLKDKFICHLFNLLRSIKRRPTTEIDWVRVAEVTREFRSGVSLSKDAKESFNKLCGALNVSCVVKMKPKVVKLSEINDDASSEGSIKKRKKQKSRERQKMKKETDLLRMQSLSEGFAVSFAGAKFEQDDEDETEKKRKNSSSVELKSKKLKT